MKRLALSLLLLLSGLGAFAYYPEIRDIRIDVTLSDNGSAKIVEVSPTFRSLTRPAGTTSTKARTGTSNAASTKKPAAADSRTTGTTMKSAGA